MWPQRPCLLYWPVLGAQLSWLLPCTAWCLADVKSAMMCRAFSRATEYRKVGQSPWMQVLGYPTIGSSWERIKEGEIYLEGAKKCKCTKSQENV